MTGCLTATTIDAGGITNVVSPMPGEDLFLYVTDGQGEVAYEGVSKPVGQYDVILARPDVQEIELKAVPNMKLHFMNFYLPTFLN